MRSVVTRTGAIALAIALSGCGAQASLDAPVSTQRSYGSLKFTPCSLADPIGGDNVPAQCTTLRVPEDPAQPQGRRIALNIAWLPATDEGEVAKDPMFFLAGGPGQSAVEVWPQVDRAFAEVRKHRDVILVDQRGTGKSNPLICRNAKGNSAVMDDGTTSTEQAVAFIERCRTQLKADPRFYSTSDAIRDLDTVRNALGAAKIDLVGGSYGTRVAQQYAMRYPQHVRTLVLDGVVPNSLALGSEHARNLDASLALQFAQCQKLPVCRERFGGDTRGQLRTLMNALREHPVEVEYRDPHTGAMARDTLTSDTVAGLTRMFAYAPQAAALLPLVLNEASQGRYAPLMSLAQLIDDQVSEQIMHGMQLSVICSEDAARLHDNPEDVDTVLGNGLAQVMVAQCKAWPHNAAPKGFNDALKTDTPTLLISGEFDPVTPPRYGDEVLKGLSKGRHLVVKGQGHINAGTGCMPKLLGQFMETADAKALDVKCLDSVGYVPPFTSFNGWEP